MTQLLKKLNIGCGVDIKQGWTNLDSAALPGVDVVHDIEKLPLPFGNDEFDEILAQDVLEHIEYIPVLKDLHRILKPGGRLTIRVPHFTSKTNFVDPTHRRMFSVSTWDFFVRSPSLSRHIEKERAYYFDFNFDKKAHGHITFEKSSRIFFFNRITESLFNCSPRMQQFYESTFLSRLFPAENICITLIK
ncbi:MAG: methyltransferase domain-containing protein [Candidatus Sungbacteria bacterium]|nr:methyltransferase domain-containing protein [bacterium]MDZ4286121.1 methyltransferase domain-containing protein [Candidatus Sungbacteria bacterium]